MRLFLIPGPDCFLLVACQLKRPPTYCFQPYICAGINPIDICLRRQLCSLSPLLPRRWKKQHTYLACQPNTYHNKPYRVASLPMPGSAAWVPFASELSAPIGIANAGDGSGRLFILEQAGKIRIWQAGNLASEPFLDITDRVGCCGERGCWVLLFTRVIRKRLFLRELY
jgi:hypothetical protein